MQIIESIKLLLQLLGAQFAICVFVVTCPSLDAPNNGDIDCSLGGDGEANPGETCTFTCDDGFGLEGDVARTCGDDGAWSGTQPRCRRGLFKSILQY